MSAETAPADAVRQALKTEAARLEAMRKAQRLLQSGGDPQAALDLLAHTLTNRLLHAPTVALRDAAARGDAELARATERLFPAPADGLSEALAQIDPDELTPKQALEALYRLKSLA